MQWILLMIVILYQWSSLVSEPMEADMEPVEQNNGDDWKTQKTSTLTMGGSRNVPGYVAGDEDLANNGVVFQFRRSIKSDNTEIEARRRSALDKNFMRFGRSDKNMLRFGKADKNMLRFGRTPNNDYNFIRYGKSGVMNPDYSRFQRAQRAGGFMRFGRDPYALSDYNDAREIDDLVEMPSTKREDDKNESNFFRLGRSSESAGSESYETPVQTVAAPSSPGSKKTSADDKNIMRFGRSDGVIRFGRSGMDPDMTRLQRADKNIMRFGRNDKNMMRFGRSDKNIMRFGRNDKNMMRFGRANDKNIMRFGRSDKNIMRFGRSDKNIMRFGRNDKNVLRFGKRDSQPLPNIFCEDDNCYHMEEKEQMMMSLPENQQLTANELNDKPQNPEYEQLQELFGRDDTIKGDDEYIIQK